MDTVWRSPHGVPLHALAAGKRRGAIWRRNGHKDGFVDVCSVSEIPDKRAVMTCLSGERVAVFRSTADLGDLEMCQHQMVRSVKDGSSTVAWYVHGTGTYTPDTGASPPPFTEKVPTFDVRVVAGRVLVTRNRTRRARASNPQRW